MDEGSQEPPCSGPVRSQCYDPNLLWLMQSPGCSKWARSISQQFGGTSTLGAVLKSQQSELCFGNYAVPWLVVLIEGISCNPKLDPGPPACVLCIDLGGEWMGFG